MDIAVYLLLGLTSVAALAVIIWRGWSLRWNKVVPPLIVGAVTECRTRNEVPTVKHLCEAQPSPAGRLLLTAINHLDWSKAENMGSLETAARHEIVKLERGLVVLEIIVGIAPLPRARRHNFRHDHSVWRHRSDGVEHHERRLEARPGYQPDFADHADRLADLHPIAGRLELF
jgi:hypothetical protein